MGHMVVNLEIQATNGLPRKAISSRVNRSKLGLAPDRRGLAFSLCGMVDPLEVRWIYFFVEAASPRSGFREACFLRRRWQLVGCGTPRSNE